jgi:adenine phosphoribosyltransferase
MNLKNYIRDIPDFPKKGILFHDVTTLFKSKEAFTFVIQKMHEHFQPLCPDFVVAIEARGFILGGALANALNCGFIPIRKPGKLPSASISEEYELEYGTDKMEIHTDALSKGNKVIVIDDLVATGGTLMAGIRLVEKLGATVTGVGSIIDMPDLGGRNILKNYHYLYLVEYCGH